MGGLQDVDGEVSPHEPSGTCHLVVYFLGAYVQVTYSRQLEHPTKTRPLNHPVCRNPYLTLEASQSVLQVGQAVVH